MNTPLDRCLVSLPVGHVSVPVLESSQIGDARRQVLRLASDTGFSEAQRGNIAIIVSELATNLVRYGAEGRIIAQAVSVGETWRLDLWALDRGPGIADILKSLTDGFSTSGTPGNGLGAVRRLSHEFDLYSSPVHGTALFCSIKTNPQLKTDFPGVRAEWSCLNLSAPGEVLCGDAWRVAEQPGGIAVLVADGLGHGPLAAAASQEACTAFAQAPFAPLASIFQRADARMRGTRGGAVSIMQTDLSRDQLRYLGYGNVTGTSRDSNGLNGKGFVSHNGTVGVQFRPAKEFEYECRHSRLILLYSDGLQSRWSFEKYPGLASRHPGVITGVLIRDFTRGRDDVTVSVVRLPDRSISE